MANNYVLLNNVDHHHLRVITERSARYGDDVNCAPTFPLEFRKVQSCYPIFFRKDPETGQFAPIALFGFQARENLDLNNDGIWDASYVPLMIQRQPFVIGLQESQAAGDKVPVVSVDMSSPRVSETEGEPLFLEHGGTSEFLASIVEMLETLRLANEMNAGFVDALLDLDLIESVTMRIELKDHSKHELLGYYTINEDRLSQLDGDALGGLQRQHYLESIYMMMASMSCFRALVEKKNHQLANQ